MHEAIDQHAKERMDMIFKEKERYQYEPLDNSPPADTQPPLARADTQVVQEAAIQIASEVMDEPPSVGSRTPNYWSICFQGGTFERIQERASGDFSLTKQTKYIAQLPALPERIVDERLPRPAHVLLVSLFHVC